MPLVVAPTFEDLYTRLRAFVVDVVPVGVAVIQGLGNRVASPSPLIGYVAMTANLISPHRTPVESWDRDNLDPDAIAIEQGTLVRVQLDCYGPASADWAVMLAATIRTEYACRLLAPVTVPLYADDPTQAPLIDSEAAYESRWIVGARLQYNPVVSTPMEFADTAEVTLINIDESYPP
jgi:hypothetical protein